MVGVFFLVLILSHLQSCYYYVVWGAPVFLVAWIHKPRNCLGYDTLLRDRIFVMYLSVLFTMNDSTFEMLQKIFWTVSFSFLSSLILFQLIPMMLWMSMWWKASIHSLFFFVLGSRIHSPIVGHSGGQMCTLHILFFDPHHVSWRKILWFPLLIWLFIVLAYISASLFSLGVMMDPR